MKINRHLFFLLFLMGMGNLSNPYSAQLFVDEAVSKEVQTIIDETMAGNHGLMNFDAHKTGLGFPESIRLSDLKPGKPYKIYKIIGDSLRYSNVHKPLSSFIKFADIWGVPVIYNGKCITTFEVMKNRRGEWSSGVFNGVYREWQSVREAWPESSGYHPVEVFYSPWKRYFHVPEANDYNLTPLYRHQYDSLERNSDPSYKKLGESKIALQYIKSHTMKSRGAK